jgi:hypothetical protein
MVIPTVTEAQTRAYEKQAWHLGCGVKPIIDNTTIRFATDWANVILKSFVAEYSVVIKKQVIDEIRAIAQKKQAETPASPSGWTETPKGSIVLTD